MGKAVGGVKKRSRNRDVLSYAEALVYDKPSIPKFVETRSTDRLDRIMRLPRRQSLAKSASGPLPRDGAGVVDALRVRRTFSQHVSLADLDRFAAEMEATFPRPDAGPLPLDDHKSRSLSQQSKFDASTLRSRAASGDVEVDDDVLEAVPLFPKRDESPVHAAMNAARRRVGRRGPGRARAEPPRRPAALRVDGVRRGLRAGRQHHVHPPARAQAQGRRRAAPRAPPAPEGGRLKRPRACTSDSGGGGSITRAGPSPPSAATLGDL